MAAKTAVPWDRAQLAPLVLIRSAEPALAERAVQSLFKQARAADPATEFTVISAPAYNRGELEIYASPSLFGEQRLLHVPDLETLNEALVTDLLAYFASPSPDVWLILRHNGGQRGKKVLDAASKSGASLIQIEAVKNARDKAALVQKLIAEQGRRAEPAAVQALVDALGSSLEELFAATSQLLSDSAEVITAQLVHKYYAGRVEATGFAVADAAAAGQAGQALTLVRHCLATGTHPLLLVSALAMKLRALAKVSGGSGTVRADQLGMAPWQAEKARREVRNWTEPGLAAAIIAVANADAEVKGGSRDPQFAVERAVRLICAAYGR